MIIDHAMGKDAASFIPHCPFPSPLFAIKMYPEDPHPAPHEFLTLMN